MERAHQRERELARARELLALLDRVDTSDWGLFAVLFTLADEARARNEWSDAAIFQRGFRRGDDLFQVNALKVGGVFLGLGGMQGWDPLLDRHAKAHGVVEYFAQNFISEIQRPHDRLSLRASKDHEQDYARIEKIRQLMGAAQQARLMEMGTRSPRDPGSTRRL